MKSTQSGFFAAASLLLLLAAAISLCQHKVRTNQRVKVPQVIK